MLRAVILGRLVDALLQFTAIDTGWWRMISAPPWKRELPGTRWTDLRNSLETVIKKYSPSHLESNPD
jgi:hypothetical protein